jgi:hypothetical protein
LLGDRRGQFAQLADDRLMGGVEARENRRGAIARMAASPIDATSFERPKAERRGRQRAEPRIIGGAEEIDFLLS